MNPALPDLIEALTHLKFSHSLNNNAIQTDTIAGIINQLSDLVAQNQPPLQTAPFAPDLPEIP